jgi:DNA-binding NtrC family response regulator
MPPLLLVVDDEKNIRRTLRMVLEGEGYAVDEAGSAEEALAQLAARPVDALLLDVKLPGLSGLEALERRLGAAGAGAGVTVPTIMISGHATIDDAVRATKLGAFDFLEKPLDRARVLLTVRNALERSRMAREVRELRARLGDAVEMLGESEAMRTLRAQIAKVAPTHARALITGESGTGKELVARALHQQSARRGRPFLKINCAAIPRDLIESELFGHERGAFTGAVERKRGLFELADGGTLLLDEVGEMSASAQAKVLRVVQTGEMQRVGGEAVLRVDVRILAATNRDLPRAVQEGSFREDLYFRLNVIPLRVPPLRDRREDIPTLVESFVAACCRENGFGQKAVGAEAMARLRAHNWPGNVRELKNVVERAAILSDGDIGAGDVEALSAGVPAVSTESFTLRQFRDHMERDFIRRKLEQLGWNVSRTAEALGIERANLHKKLRSYGIARDGE